MRENNYSAILRTLGVGLYVYVFRCIVSSDSSRKKTAWRTSLPSQIESFNFFAFILIFILYTKAVIKIIKSFSFTCFPHSFLLHNYYQSRVQTYVHMCSYSEIIHGAGWKYSLLLLLANYYMIPFQLNWINSVWLWLYLKWMHPEFDDGW